MIRRGGEQGWTRKSSQTPAEYAGKLTQVLPSSGEDIDLMTQAFVEGALQSPTY